MRKYLIFVSSGLFMCGTVCIWVPATWENEWVVLKIMQGRLSGQRTIAKIKWIDFLVWVSHELSSFGAEENIRSTSLFILSPSRGKHKKNSAIALCLTVLFIKLWHILHCMLPWQWLPFGSTVEFPLLLLASFPGLCFLWGKECSLIK